MGPPRDRVVLAARSLPWGADAGRRELPGLGEPDLCRILAPRLNVEDVRRVDPDVRPLGRLLKTLELPVGQPRRDNLRIALERQLGATHEVNVACHHCEFSPAAAQASR